MNDLKRDKRKVCFIITPIGEPGSSIRKRVDQWEESIYKPAFAEEFQIVRADKISTPGFITSQILNLVISAQLVVIDYTDLNPNVMYEAAVRHLSKKTFIQIYPEKLKLPFDIHNLRSISYDPENILYPASLIEKLREAYKETSEADYKPPEVLPIEFDLKKIVSDPEKFVSLLKDHFIQKNGNNDYISLASPGISEVLEPSLSSLATGSVTKRIRCPNCGTTQVFYDLPPTSLGSMGLSKHYRCNSCGTEFE